MSLLSLPCSKILVACPHIYFITDNDDPDLEGDPDAMPDPADVMDMDAFEELAQNNDFFSELALSPNQPAVDDLPEAPIHAGAQTNQHEAEDMEMMQRVFVDHFPSGQAGTPIPSIVCGSSLCESHQDTHADMQWAPFTSECDWLFVHWAKLHGPTSSLLESLLGIPEVCFLSSFPQ